ncbi:MAG: LysR family transcriptional regulator [Peptococcaceae bacterium]|nr:LysR family transcriptional regulator [Peptococcaceae bacterium]
MKIKHLYYFLVVKNTKSINKAAQKLFISQQHLSRIISSIEDEFHIKLFTRTPTGIELTEKGMFFSTYAEKIVNDYREMQSFFYLDALPVLEQKDNLQGNCQIAFPFFFSLFLNDFIQEFDTLHPGINIRYYEDYGFPSAETLCNPPILHVIVEHGEQIQSLLQQNKGLKSYYIGETSVSFCVNKNSPLASKPILTKEDIDAQKFTIYPQRVDYTLFKNVDILFVSSNIHQHLDSVIHNNSICFVPTYIRSGIEKLYPDVVLRSFELQYDVPIYVIYSDALTLTDADKAVIQFAAQYMQKLSKSVNLLPSE